jgi:hypothetical protein
MRGRILLAPEVYTDPAGGQEVRWVLGDCPINPLGAAYLTAGALPVGAGRWDKGLTPASCMSKYGSKKGQNMTQNRSKYDPERVIF